MKKILLGVYSIFLFIPFWGLSQSENIFIDPRDNQEYRTANINGTIWMLDNLNYETELSLVPTDEEKASHELTGIRGRYYHFQERDSVCPKGWRLPQWEDWSNYIYYLTEDMDTLRLTYEIGQEPEHFHVFEGFSETINLFTPDNPLNLRPVGRMQGSRLSTNPDTPFADFWTSDRNETTNGTSHAHLWAVINVHSHEHNMEPSKPDEMRRFMCRCIKDK